MVRLLALLVPQPLDAVTRKVPLPVKLLLNETLMLLVPCPAVITAPVGGVQL